MAKKVKSKRRERGVFRVLDWPDIVKCEESIRAIALLNKPFVEVMTSSKSTDPKDLLHDLELCLNRFNMKYGVKSWIRPSHSPDGTRYRFGFYKYDWTLSASEAVYEMSLSDFDRAWISGLLYGYHPEAIQKFIDERVKRRT